MSMQPAAAATDGACCDPIREPTAVLLKIAFNFHPGSKLFEHSRRVLQRFMASPVPLPRPLSRDPHPQVRPEVQRMLIDEFYPPLDSATEVRVC